MKFILTLTWLAALALALPTPVNVSSRCISNTADAIATCDKKREAASVVVEAPKVEEKKRCISSTGDTGERGEKGKEGATCDKKREVAAPAVVVEAPKVEKKKRCISSTASTANTAETAATCD